MSRPRLHILTATESSFTVVLRRGPSQEVAAIGWDRASGEVKLGQWLKGRIYEHRSDLSPDGRHMIYFAGDRQSIPKGQWYTCISRAPFLRALSFLPQSGTWYGGGAFTEDGHVFLNGGGTLSGSIDGLVQASELALPHGTDGFHMGALYLYTMIRRGWMSDQIPGYGAGLWKEAGRRCRIELTFEVGLPNRSTVANRYAVVDPGKDRTEYPDWEWAEPWKNGIQFASNGALYFAPLAKDGILGEPKALHDFGDMVFEHHTAPYEGIRESLR